MYDQPWYKLLAWTLASFYFFVMAATVISIFKSGPSEIETMRWMQAMMDAMHTSLMGWTSENHHYLNLLLAKTSGLAIPSIMLGALTGIILKMRRLRDVK